MDNKNKPTPDPGAQPLPAATQTKHVISLGAGVQSSTMALMAACGEITPMPECAIFADTQAEPRSVYDWLDWLEGKLPFPVYRVTSGNLAERVTRIQRSHKSGKLYTKTLVPVFLEKPNGKAGMLGRRCTTDYKLIPIIRKLTALVNPPRSCKKILATQWIGISWDEVDRMKPPLRAWISNHYPLVDRRITRQGCLEWMEKRGYPKPPRSACVFCPYHSDAEWLRLKTQEPEAFKMAADWEKKYQESVEIDEVTQGKPFLHRSLVQISDVQFDTTRGQMNFINECEGMCGV